MKPDPRTPHKLHTLHKGDYGNDGGFTARVGRVGDTLRVELLYPPYEADPFGGGRIRYVELNQESVRASDGIRLHYDFDRDGFVVEQETVFSWPVGDLEYDPKRVVVACIPSWGSQVVEPYEPPRKAATDRLRDALKTLVAAVTSPTKLVSDDDVVEQALTRIRGLRNDEVGSAEPSGLAQVALVAASLREHAGDAFSRSLAVTLEAALSTLRRPDETKED